MRRVHRLGLDLESRQKLAANKEQCIDAPAARHAWKNFRSSNAGKAVVDVLALMAGPTERCYYCGDSRGADVDHFIPIDQDWSEAFTWPNLQLVCPPCNRQKNAMPTVIAGVRTIVDPCRDDPWNHIVLIAETGIVTPRTFGDGSVDLLGGRTVSRLTGLNLEAVIERRRRSIRRIVAAAERVVLEGDTIPNRRDLLWAASDDTFGIAIWFASREGSTNPAFTALRQTHRSLWRRFVRVAAQS
jgi:hypothetical protein